MEISSLLVDNRNLLSIAHPGVEWGRNPVVEFLVVSKLWQAIAEPVRAVRNTEEFNPAGSYPTAAELVLGTKLKKRVILTLEQGGSKPSRCMRGEICRKRRVGEILTEKILSDPSLSHFVVLTPREKKLFAAARKSFWRNIAR